MAIAALRLAFDEGLMSAVGLGSSHRRRAVAALSALFVLCTQTVTLPNFIHSLCGFLVFSDACNYHYLKCRS